MVFPIPVNIQDVQYSPTDSSPFVIAQTGQPVPVFINNDGVPQIFITNTGIPPVSLYNGELMDQPKQQPQQHVPVNAQNQRRKQQLGSCIIF